VEVVASLSQGRTAAAQCGLFTHKSVSVIFETPCNIWKYAATSRLYMIRGSLFSDHPAISCQVIWNSV